MSNPKESIARYKVGTIYLKKKVEDSRSLWAMNCEPLSLRMIV